LFPNDMQTIRDFQAFHEWLDQKNNFNRDIFLNTVLLCGEVGELAQVLKKVHWMTEQERNDGEAAITREEALAEHRESLGQELADCLAYIFKLANYIGVDLQEAYLKKMAENVERTWKYKK
jgi:NTP pyrophosphatase (non-canonical NTP hydrolase)